MITLLSPYHGGSHQAWAEGYQQHSAYQVNLLTLPDRFWKWRMHGGAVTLARRFIPQAEAQRPFLLLATDMLDLTTFLALTRTYTHNVPVALYMHENQLTYPLPQDKSSGPMRRQQGERDHHYSFINYASMLAADTIYFNSQYHQESLFAALPNFLKHFPEYNELVTVPTLRQKSRVLPVGIDLQRLTPPQPIPYADPPLIIWNQRWEYDKNPTPFFEALYHIADKGIPFQLALCGQQYGKRPFIFDEALTRLANNIIHIGHANAQQYQRLLWQATLTISTAHHEFFGISILEAIACHTFPLLPHRLSYPELLPIAYHPHCLYEDQVELIQRLQTILLHPNPAKEKAAALATAVMQYDWSHMAPRYDASFKTIDVTISKGK